VNDPDQVSVNAGFTLLYGFSASPVVYGDKVFVGHLNGHMYALDAKTGKVIWRYPVGNDPPLMSPTKCNPSSPGIASTPFAVSSVGGNPAIVFGAPDPSSNNGDGKVWALNANTGTLIWKSPVLAVRASNEQIGYDSPVVWRNHVYVGISNHCDSPIIAGKVFALDLATGALLPGFTTFVASAIRGGGLWSSPAATADGDVLITTGNGCVSYNGGCTTEPNPNHALSMIRLDGASGNMIWKFQPVPWSLDDDPDWAAVPTIQSASCGIRAVAPMKDGYTHALDIGPSAPTGDPVALALSLRRWSFPPAAIPFMGGDHGDIRYTRGAATWKDVVFAVTGGRDVSVNPTAGYSRLYALNTCSSDYERVRWWLEFDGWGWPTMGAPSVTRGIVYVGTAEDTLYAIADPDVYPAIGWQCDYPGVSNADCAANGFRLTPIPAILAKVALSGGIRTTPALAKGVVFVTTDAGYAHALAP
jgi:outer membrane protein assembly factor BamB